MSPGFPFVPATSDDFSANPLDVERGSSCVEPPVTPLDDVPCYAERMGSRHSGSDTTTQQPCQRLAGDVPPDLADNPLVRLWQTLTPAEAELLDGLAGLDQADGAPSDDEPDRDE